MTFLSEINKNMGREEVIREIERVVLREVPAAKCEDGENKDEDLTLKRKGEENNFTDETVMEDHDTETGEYEEQEQPLDNTSQKIDQIMIWTLADFAMT